MVVKTGYQGGPTFPSFPIFPYFFLKMSYYPYFFTLKYHFRDKNQELFPCWNLLIIIFSNEQTAKNLKF